MRVFNKSRIPKPRVGLTDLSPHINPIADSTHLDIEVGCGVGLHALNYARANPERTLIAIDRSEIRMRKMLERIATAGEVWNLIPIRENAVWFITHEICDNSVENYFFLYPNPNPKKKQANKRWHQMPFMSHVIATLKKKGRIHLATNMEYYAIEAEKFFVEQWNLTLILKQIYASPDEMPFVARTHFEKKYIERGETCWNFIFEK